MEKQSKDAFEIELKRRTRKKLVNYVVPTSIVLALILLLLFYWAGDLTKLGIIGWIVDQMPLSIIVIVLYIALIPFLWFTSKKECRDKAYDEMLKDISKSLVDNVLVPGEAVKVKIIKSKDNSYCYGKFVMDLQHDDVANFYAVLGERDNLISIYAILKGEDEKRPLDVVSKEEFSEYYQLLDDTEIL